MLLYFSAFLLCNDYRSFFLFPISVQTDGGNLWYLTLLLFDPSGILLIQLVMPSLDRSSNCLNSLPPDWQYHSLPPDWQYHIVQLVRPRSSCSVSGTSLDLVQQYSNNNKHFPLTVIFRWYGTGSLSPILSPKSVISTIVEEIVWNTLF